MGVLALAATRRRTLRRNIRLPAEAWDQVDYWANQYFMTSSHFVGFVVGDFLRRQREEFGEAWRNSSEAFRSRHGGGPEPPNMPPPPPGELLAAGPRSREPASPSIPPLQIEETTFDALSERRRAFQRQGRFRDKGRR